MYRLQRFVYLHCTLIVKVERRATEKRLLYG